MLIGIAQEKASSWRSWKKKGQEKASHPHMEWGRQMVFIPAITRTRWSHNSAGGPRIWTASCSWALRDRHPPRSARDKSA